MYIAIDVGGTNTRVVSSPSLDKPLLENRKVFNTSQNFDEAVSNILGVINQMDGNVEAVGLGVPGDINAEKTVILSATNLSGWGKSQPIVDILKKELGCPVFMDNDAIMGALGEAYYGLGNSRDFLYMIWGTGVGGATAHWDKGKVVVSQVDWPQYLSKWEFLFSGSNIKKLFGKPAEDLDESEWREIMGRFRKSVVGLSNELNQKMIVVGGGVAIKQRARILNAVRKLSFPQVFISELGENTSLYGAFALIRDSL